MDSDSQPFIKLATSSHSFHINPEQIEAIIQRVCEGLGLGAFQVSWDFIQPDEMRELNRQYRNKDSSTDVLSFPQEEWAEPQTFTAPTEPLAPLATEDHADTPPRYLGDVIISPHDAMLNAQNIGHGLDRETCFLLVHGILHLCGHDHLEPEEEDVMTAEQRSIMSFLDTLNAEPLWSRCVTAEAF